MEALFRSNGRKLGLVSLALALLASGSWFRTYLFRDRVTFPMLELGQQTIETTYGLIRWSSYEHDHPSFGYSSFRHESWEDTVDTIKFWAEYNFESRTFSTPHWVVVLTLSLLSAFLLLGARRRQQREIHTNQPPMEIDERN